MMNVNFVLLLFYPVVVKYTLEAHLNDLLGRFILKLYSSSSLKIPAR